MILAGVSHFRQKLLGATPPKSVSDEVIGNAFLQSWSPSKNLAMGLGEANATSIGPLEGTNNKIKTVNRQHYGLRDKEFFQLKLYQLHQTKYALVG